MARRLPSPLHNRKPPQPRKPRPNLSLYSDNHLLLIRLIQRVQQQTSLSLPDIAAAFRAADYDPTTIEIELLSEKYHAGRRDFIIPFEAEGNSHVGLNVPAEFLAELGAKGLLENTTHLDESQREIAGLLWAACSEGVPITFFNAKSGSYTSSQFTVGAEWFPELDKHFGTEFNLNLKNSNSSFSVYFSFPYEQSTGYKKYE